MEPDDDEAEDTILEETELICVEDLYRELGENGAGRSRPTGHS